MTLFYGCVPAGKAIVKKSLSQYPDVVDGSADVFIHHLVLNSTSFSRQPQHVCLLIFSGSIYFNQYNPRSDCSKWISLIWVHIVLLP